MQRLVCKVDVGRRGRGPLVVNLGGEIRRERAPIGSFCRVGVGVRIGIPSPTRRTSPRRVVN